MSIRDKMVDEFREKRERQQAEARQRQKEGKSSDGEAGGRGKKQNLTQKIEQGYSDRNERSTDAIRAREAGTNREYLAITDRLAEERPEMLQKVLSGEIM